MSRRVRHGKLVVLGLTIPLVSCGGDRLPVSPSAVGAPLVAGAAGSTAPSDYHEVPYPDPSPAPAPTPEPTPTPSPATSVTISIVGSAGITAFSPNPLPASVGASVVWTNNDVTIHRIVLDDAAGTLIGNMAPGESSAPIPVTEATVSYHCTLHPSMTGTIQDPAAAAPAPAPPELQGTWTAVFRGQRATLTLRETEYEFTWGVQPHVGTISVGGDQIEFSSSSCDGSGIYRWLLTGNSLLFSAVERDPCPGRSEFFNNRTYTRSS